jgi:hypothetical protein
MNRMRGELWEMGSTITDSQLAGHQKKNPPGNLGNRVPFGTMFLSGANFRYPM